jgi:nucleoside 2-deoxyribosyltransferase
MRLYLAGPEVFLPDPLQCARTKQEICQRYGFIGLFPWDSGLDLAHLSPYDMGLAIYRSNLALMNDCQLMVANMTPFRGASMDVGTAFEMGYMAAQGKPVFGYSNDGRLYASRVAEQSPGRDDQGMTIEQFEMVDNLMLEAAAVISGGTICRQSITADGYYTDLTLFEAAVRAAAESLLQ